MFWPRALIAANLFTGRCRAINIRLQGFSTEVRDNATIWNPSSRNRRTYRHPGSVGLTDTSIVRSYDFHMTTAANMDSILSPAPIPAKAAVVN